MKTWLSRAVWLVWALAASGTLAARQGLASLDAFVVDQGEMHGFLSSNTGHASLDLAQIMGGVDLRQAAVPDASTRTPASLDMWVGQVEMVQDLAYVERDGQRLVVTPGMRLRQHDVLTTAATASATIGVVFDDHSTLAIAPGTQIVIQRFAFDTTTRQGYFDTHIERGTVAVQAAGRGEREPLIATPNEVAEPRHRRVEIIVR